MSGAVFVWFGGGTLLAMIIEMGFEAIARQRWWPDVRDALEGAVDDVPAWIAIPIRAVIIAGFLIFVLLGSVIVALLRAARWLWRAVADA